MVFGRTQTLNDTGLIPMKIADGTWRRTFLGLLLIMSGVGGVDAQDVQTFDLDLIDGQVQGDISSIRVTQNDRVVIRWRSDREIEIHLHGYDLKAVLSPNTIEELDFEAHATGRFPITAHGHHTDSHDEPVLLHVEVYPD